MASIELYINRRLCDIENPSNFSVYLKRQLLNPSELSTKDAQHSYDITLPASPVNNEIFGHTNTEEVKGKFARLYDAILYVDEVKIFEGKFRMSEITKTYYKGNLGIPAQKTVKDIFGDLMMNQAGSWMIPFEKIEDMTKYNTGKHDKEKFGEIPPCIFPLVLYGLLPKERNFTDKDLLDDNVAFKKDHFPPSVNCLQALKTIFENKGLKLSGSAFNDERLTNLFVSYKNPKEYEMLWNYGRIGNMQIAGSWTNYNKIGSTIKVEENWGEHDDTCKIYSVDLLKSSLDPVKILSDKGENIKKDSKGYTTITIPYSALYKINFYASVSLGGPEGEEIENKVHHDSFPCIISPKSYLSTNGYTFDSLFNRRLEIKVLRDRHKEEAFYRHNMRVDNVFYKQNIDQENDNNYPKYFPKIGEVNFIDPAQNEFLLCGLSFGTKNPLRETPLAYCSPMATSGGKSWEGTTTKTQSFSAVKSPGYIERNRVGGVIKDTPSDKFKVDLKGGAYSIASIYGDRYKLTQGDGRVMQVVWLEQGEHITIATHMDEGHHIGGKFTSGWIRHKIDFNLSIQAFQESKSWLKMHEMNGSSKEPMNWSDEPGLLDNQLNLTRFLPSEAKINDWIENFCKAFNLSLVQTEGGTFELNTNRQRDLSLSSVINLDEKTDVDYGRKNSSLKLPSVYEIGFTIDKNEEGYFEKEDDGGGILETGSPEVKRINQTSSFSHNWFKKLKAKRGIFTPKEVWVPVVADKEVWSTTDDYEEMQKKNYMNKAQRFWYRSGNGVQEVVMDEGKKIDAALVTDTFTNEKRSLRLNYKDNRTADDSTDTILSTYFTLLTDAGNCYTTVECYLTPEEYNRIGDSFIQLNGDLYYATEVDGYDPQCRKKATLKLIRKSA